MSDVKPALRTPRRRRRHAPTTPDAIELAMEAEKADASADSPARQLIREQQKLVRAQRASETIGAGLKVLTGLVGLAAAAAIGAMIWQASHERGLVIEAFSVPPPLAEKGLTGEVLAGQIEDRLTALEAATDSARSQATYTNDWGHDIKVEIPQTGVSISELQRYLRQWLGRQTRVGGDLYQTPDGLKLTVRTGAQGGVVFHGTEATLDEMVQKGAEALFERTQPYRYGVYLLQSGRVENARRLYAALAENGPPEERAWATLGRGVVSETTARSLVFQREAVALDPDLALGWSNIGNVEGSLGHPDAALEAYRRADLLLRRRDLGGMSERSAAITREWLPFNVGIIKGDQAAALDALRKVEALPGYVGSRETARLARPQLLAQQHDIAAARALIPPGVDDGALSAPLLKWESFTQPNYAIAVALEDWPAALTQARAIEAAFSRDVAPGSVAETSTELGFVPQIAEALARTGQVSEAQALIVRTPLDCDFCVRKRAIVEELAGRPTEADRWFATTISRNKAPPQAYQEWGQVKLGRGDIDGAILLLRQAVARGPDFAEAHATLGEALLRKKDLKGALASLRTAERLTPKWGRLHLVIGEALAAQGEVDAARLAWRRAGTLSLSAADRDLLAQRLPRG